MAQSTRHPASLHPRKTVPPALFAAALALILQACTDALPPDPPSHQAPDNPCQLVSCSADGGCARTNQSDGTICGESTPCQAAPTCQQGTCVAAAPSALEPAWSYRIDAGTIEFYGVVDRDGNPYWQEWGTPDGMQLVSATPDGQVRFRAPITANLTFPYGSAYSTGTAVVGDDALTWSRSALVAFDRADGGFRWAVNFQPLWEDAGITATRPELDAVLGSAPGQLVAVVEGWSGPPYDPPPMVNDLYGVDLSTGAVLWHRLFYEASGAYLPVSDAQGNLYLQQREDLPDGGYASALISIDAQGQDRASPFAREVQDPPIATAGGALLFGGDRWFGYPPEEVLSSDRNVLRWPDGGAFALSLEADGGDFLSSPVLDPARNLAYAISGTSGRPPLLVGYDLSRARAAWTVPLTGKPPYGDPNRLMLLEDGSVLVASGVGDAGTLGQLQRFGPDGGELFTCALPSPSYGLVYGNQVARGKWFIARAPDSVSPVVLQAYEVPGLDSAASGWVGPYGDPGGSFQER